jgi:hypothetical protein
MLLDQYDNLYYLLFNILAYCSERPWKLANEKFIELTCLYINI